MDPLLIQIVVGVVSNALWSALQAIAGHEDDPSSVIDRAVDDARYALADVPAIAPDVGGEGLREFLASPDVGELVRQLFVARLTDADQSLETVRADFASMYRFWRDPPREDDDPADRLFDALLRACEAALDSAIDRGSLAAHEAKDSARYRILRDEMANVGKAVAVLTRADTTPLRDILTFERTYRQQVIGRHGTITPPNFDAARRVPIDDLYVQPRFMSIPRFSEDEARLVSGPDLASTLYRGVVLGHPGTGKSTFTRKVATDSAGARMPKAFLRDRATPLLVTLRNYGAERSDRQSSIVEFIESASNTDYQLRPPPGAIEYLLTSGRAVVLFDGLDELLDTSYRQEVTADIERFCDLYPAVPVLVTSRAVGYEQAPLDPARFTAHRLLDFDAEQVEDYVSKWFALSDDLSQHEREEQRDSFMRDSEGVADLRANALMLALMCNIYRGEGYIPRNRPAVYEKCAVMLFERWDRSRRIRTPLEFERHLRPAMQFLAHWIYSDRSLQAGVTAGRLIQQATTYLTERRFESEDAARQEARRFIEFCKGRAWVFTDTGTTGAGEGLYEFTHGTFLEFFTAEHLVRTSRTPADLTATLVPRVAQGEWDVVAQLAYQLQDDQLEGAADELLRAVIPENLDPGDQQQRYLLSFAARCLDFLVPRPATTRTVTSAIFTRTVLGAASLVDDRGEAGRADSRVGEAFRELVAASWENREPIVQATEEGAVDVLRERSGEKGAAASDIALNVDMALASHEPTELREVWLASAKRIADTAGVRLRELAERYERVAYDGVYLGLVAVRDLVAWHGVSALFESREFIVYENRIRPAINEILISLALGSGRAQRGLSEELVLDGIKDLGRLVLDAPTPWFQTRTIHIGAQGVFRAHPGGDLVARTNAVQGDLAFGLFAAAAVILEVADGSGEAELASVLESAGDSEAFAPVFPLVDHRYRDGGGDPAEAVEALGASEAQRVLMEAWARREVDFVDGPDAIEPTLSAGEPQGD